MNLPVRLRRLLAYSLLVLAVSLAYFVYVYFASPPLEERETWLSEVGEGVGELALWCLVVIYGRTILKLALGKGAMARRLLPDYGPPEFVPGLPGVLGFLDRTHVYVGIATSALILLHAVLVGLPLEILFFPAVLVLVLWQTLFGLFLAWRYSPKELKKFAYLVHAQLFTGIMIGIFAWLGHLLVDS